MMLVEFSKGVNPGGGVECEEKNPNPNPVVDHTLGGGILSA
jgi:hypothetical protein